MVVRLHTMAVAMFGLMLLILGPGCGDSREVIGQLAPVGGAQNGEVRMRGVWGGYFPGSSLQNPRNGIELHFDRPVHRGSARHAAGFIHRDGLQGSRHDVLVEETGSRVKLTFDPGTPDQGIFEGEFEGPHTLRGTFANTRRGERFPVTLQHSDSVPLGTLKPASPVAARLAQQFQDGSDTPEKFVVLQLDFTARSQNVITTTGGAIELKHSLVFGYGRYLDQFPNQAQWYLRNGDPNFLGFADRTSPVNLEWNRGVSTVRTMVFYPDWVLLELFPPAYAGGEGQPIYDGVVYQVGSIELPWTSLINHDGSQMASGSWVAQNYDTGGRTAWDYFTVESLSMSYTERESHSADTDEFAVSLENPGYQNLEIDGTTYSVPGNTVKALRYLGFSIPNSPTL